MKDLERLLHTEESTLQGSENYKPPLHTVMEIWSLFMKPEQESREK